jgi:hypothetical protein
MRSSSSSSLIVDFLRLTLSILPFSAGAPLAWPGISAFDVLRDRRRHRYRRVAGDHTRLCWRPDRWCAQGLALATCVYLFFSSLF